MSEEPPVVVLMVSGSTRAGSTNTGAVRTAAATAPADVRAVVYDGLVGLPHFNPDDDVDPLPREVERLRTAIAEADAVLFCTPEYAGALPGSFKNLLDWTVGGGQINGTPGGWVNVSPRGAHKAHESLRTVLGYVEVDLVPQACVDLAVTRDLVGTDGLVADETVRAGLREVLMALRDHVRARRAG